MASDAEWGRRLRDARRAYEQRHDGSLSYREIGERVGVLLNRTPFSHPTVRSWFIDGQEPESFAVARALAVVLEADGAALIVGPQTTKPAEVGGLSLTPGPMLTPAQVARAEEKSAKKTADRAAAKSARPKRRPGNGGHSA